MEGLRQNVFRFAIVVLCALSTFNPVLSLQCSFDYSYERCTLESLKVNSSNLGSLKFPIHSNIELRNAQMDYLSPEVVLRMKWVSNLTITNGKVGKIYLKTDLLKLVATGSNTFDVIIDDGVNESLDQLIITQNQLYEIPKNVANLKSLTVLNLRKNKIETVDLSEFYGLTKLATIDLSENRIYYLVPFDSFELISLQTFMLNNNFLTELDFEGWNMPMLRTLHIQQNSLTFVKNFNEESFLTLKTYDDSYNLYDCRWRAEFVSNLKAWTNFKGRSFSNDCTKSVQLSSATYRMLNMRDIRNYTFDFDNKEQLQKQVSGMIDSELKHSQQIDALTKLVREQTEQLDEVSGVLQTQQTAIDGLLAQIEEQRKQLADMSQLVVPSGRNVPKGFREKLIQEVVEVIRRNLVEVED